jgi:hypothetical protein
VVGVIALIVGAVYVFTGSTGVSGDRAEAAYQACESAVALKLDLSTGVQFSDEAIDMRGDGSTAIVTGRVLGSSGGRLVVAHFSCAVTQYPTGEWGAPGVNFQQ